MRRPHEFVSHRRTSTVLVSATLLGIGLAPACSSGGGSSGGAPAEHVGSSCTAASQCYATLDASALNGQVTCLTQLTNGYCTHTCQSDSDCCSVPGECVTGFKQVCASFESTNQKYCFLGCDTSDIAAAPDAGTTDPSLYCQTWASASFTCRSTGGGSQNRKFCGP
jgi:hypothetical protein